MCLFSFFMSLINFLAHKTFTKCHSAPSLRDKKGEGSIGPPLRNTQMRRGDYCIYSEISVVSQLCTS